MASSWQPRFSPRSGLTLWLATAVAVLGIHATVNADDAAWPRRFDSSSGSFVIYQPQPESLTGDLLSCRAAFSLLKGEKQNAAFGVLWFTERLQVDRDSSSVDARGLDVTRVRLPGITAAESQRYEKLVEDEAAQWDLSGSLEELQAGLAASEKERASVADLSTTPPRILFSYQRAILIQYDGDPALVPIEGTNLQRVANTPFAVIYDPAGRDYYLSGARLWYTSKDPLAHWREIPTPPTAVVNVVPPDTSSTDQLQGEPPAVLTATEPTELISIDGQPNFAPLVGGDLLYVTNTESDVVREVSTQAIFVLLAGRWYRAASPDGPWSFVRGDQLPESLSRVPADSPKGHILAAVAGTDQADDAVADAEIPQTSAIRRDSSDFQVAYDETPQFEAIEGTNLQYAVNTDAQVILADGRYYSCDQGVWYVADRPDGPWSVSETRPLEVDDIPPSCPAYNLRYAYIYDSTPSVVYMGYLPGYLGCFPYHGTVVYGTGYQYRAWRSPRRYFPRPFTWGFFPRYNPWLSRWSFGYSFSAGFLRVGSRWNSEPQVRGIYTPPLWFGPGGYHRPLLGPDRMPLRTRRALRDRQRASDVRPTNIYNRSVNLRHVDRSASRVPLHGFRPYPAKPVSLPNNVFAGKDGKVYQRDSGGKWKVNKGHRWVSAKDVVGTPTAPSRAGATTAPGPKRETNPPPVRPFPTPLPAPAPPSTQPRVAPPARPTPPPTQPRVAPPARPTPPPLSRQPGNLERDYQARERARNANGPEASPPSKRPEPAPSAPPAPTPARPAPKQVRQPKNKTPGNC
jgi:hypothetical protein